MMLYATFEVAAAGLDALGTNETAALEQMLAAVMGHAKAQFQYVAAGDNTTQMRVQARILTSAAPAAIKSGCCTQYEQALRSALQATGRSPCCLLPRDCMHYLY